MERENCTVNQSVRTVEIKMKKRERDLCGTLVCTFFKRDLVKDKSVDRRRESEVFQFH